MKKIVFLLITISISLFAQAQNAKRIVGVKAVPASVKMKAIKPQYDVANKKLMQNLDQPKSTLPRNPKAVHTTTTFTDVIIGNTIYDFQSFRGVGKRISNNVNGTISTVWNEAGITGSGSIGYNYYDGTNWNSSPVAIPVARFPNIGVTATGEFIVAKENTYLLVSGHTVVADFRRMFQFFGVVQ